MDNKDIQIIRALLDAGDDYVSGNRLAELLGVSRVAVWSHMEKLREQGFDFDAARSKGYRLVKRPEELNEVLIHGLFTGATGSLRAIVLDEIDSTNSEAERLLANDTPTPFVVLAKSQTSGRGRLGRVWHSSRNGNVYASFAFRPEVSPAGMPLFTLWMGVNICECLASLTRLDCKVKWPNDLHLNGKKLAGILTEARMETDQVRDVVLGIGLNVNSSEEEWPEQLRAIATSLQQETGNALDINKVVAALSGRIMIAYQQFIDGDHRSILKEKWPKYDTLFGHQVSLMQNEQKITGIAKGIDASGSLVVERENNSRYLARAGEVTLEK